MGMRGAGPPGRPGRAGSRPGALLGAVALLVAGACGAFGDEGTQGGDASEGAPLERLQVPDDLDGDAGCGEEGTTDPADLSSGRAVARCAAGSPAPARLAAPATLRVGVRSRSEEVAPILLADHFDEFGAENLAVEVTEYGTATELFEALGDGEVDVVAGELDGPFFDLVHEGAGARLALGGPVAPSAHDTETPQAGLWLRTDLLDPADDWMDLEDVGLPVAVEDSIADAVAYPVDAVLEQDDMSLNAVNLTVEGGETAAEGLVDGELSAAWLGDPHWQSVLDSDFDIELVATPPVAESLGGVVLADRLVDRAQDRAIGVAFSRAVIRTINTYLAGDYQDDDEVVAALTETTGLSEDEIVGTPAWVFDWEVREGTTSRIQDALVTLGGVLYERPLSEPRLVDRSLYEEAVRDQDQG
jgi:NitT/TauT family transport system substrate-binding protein